jgi:hypothetical protein
LLIVLIDKDAYTFITAIMGFGKTQVHEYLN